MKLLPLNRALRQMDLIRNELVLIVLVIGMVSFTAVGAGPSAAQETPSPAFVVVLQSDGSATVTVTYTFDLSSEAEAEAFQDLQDDRTAREALRTRFKDRLQSVADAAADRTGRTMSITAASIEIETANGGTIGVARLNATWIGLARTEGNRLVITEPFTSEFTPDRPFVLRVPDGYEISTVTPAPTDREAGMLEWTSGATLTGFEVVLTTDGTDPMTDPGSSSTRTSGQPGFGLLVAMFAISILVSGFATDHRLL